MGLRCASSQDEEDPQRGVHALDHLLVFVLIGLPLPARRPDPHQEPHPGDEDYPDDGKNCAQSLGFLLIGHGVLPPMPFGFVVEARMVGVAVRRARRPHPVGPERRAGRSSSTG